MSENKEIKLEENKLNVRYSGKNLQLFEEKKHPQLINWYDVVEKKSDDNSGSINAEESVEVHVKVKSNCCRIL